MSEATAIRTSTTAPAASPRHAAAPAPTGHRMAWLDALRGLAALAVVYVHFAQYALPGLRDTLTGWFDFGRYGVLLFFAVSGYVIPMSLERHGSLRRFWVGRVFRLYPAYLLAAGSMLALAATGIHPISAMLRNEPLTGLAAHATMTTGLLGISGLVGVFWTLAYEMIFYVLVAALFALGLHRRSGWLALALAGAALVLGGGLPQEVLGGTGGRRLVTAVGMLALLVVSVLGYVSGRRRLVVGCAVAGLGVLAFPLLNGGATSGQVSWQATAFLAIMLAGTTAYRMQHRLTNRRRGALVIGGVLLCVLAAGVVNGQSPAQRRTWVITILAVAASFGLGFLARRLPVPGWMLWLGKVSYSLYLLHQILLYVARHYVPDLGQKPLAVQLLGAAVYLAVLLTWAGWAYRLVERPGQDAGRWVARALDQRWGSDKRVPAVRRPAQRPPADRRVGAAPAPR
jgi:peptidoglycan/LPS O-acetylase OafA/YrhL